MGVDATAVASVVGIETEFREMQSGNLALLPQRIAVFGQGASASTYSNTKFQATSAYQVGNTVGFGSPLHHVALQLWPEDGDGIGTIPATFYPLDDDGSAVTAAGTITISGTATEAHTAYIRSGGVLSAPITVALGGTPTVAEVLAAINAAPSAPVIAADGTTNVTTTAKWGGASGNGIEVEVINGSKGITWTIVQPASGATNPSLTTALAQVGNVWETLCINCLDIADTTSLDAYQVLGESRWGTLVHKPLAVVTGNPEASSTTAVTVSSARTDDRVNFQAVGPGSPSLPCAIAARAVARIAKMANESPASDYNGLELSGIIPGTDGEQWLYAAQDVALKAGSSTVDLVGSTFRLGDTVTFYAPTGQPSPAYRYVNDIVKIQNIIFNLALIFASSDWAGAPLIPDGQVSVERRAKRPSSAIAAVKLKLEALGLRAIISDPETAKANVTATINASNNRRLDVVVPVQLSGNTGIKSVTLRFGFYYGTAVAA